MLKIYGGSTFNATKVLFTALELGLDFEYIHLDFAKGEHKSEEHLSRHPLGKVPALEHNGKYLFESASLCRYLSNISGQKLYSADPYRAAEIDQMVDFNCHHVGRWLAVYFYQEVILKMYFKKDADPVAIKEAKGFLDQYLPFIDQTLATNKFLCGKELTIADTVTYPYFSAAQQTTADLSAYANIGRWMAELSERPAYQAAVSKMSLSEL
ncbi:MAG: glutathione S-transferase family protein [Pseudohongiellaceae bacterium]|nr:glutathione S-transferase family protein [Pseudohongiellaceae bacterium]